MKGDERGVIQRGLSPRFHGGFGQNWNSVSASHAGASLAAARLRLTQSPPAFLLKARAEGSTKTSHPSLLPMCVRHRLVLALLWVLSAAPRPGSPASHPGAALLSSLEA